MNIIGMRQEKRAGEIIAIESSITKAVKQKKGLDMPKLIIATMANLNLSRRTASDYVKIALFNLGIDLDGKK